MLQYLLIRLLELACEVRRAELDLRFPDHGWAWSDAVWELDRWQSVLRLAIQQDCGNVRGAVWEIYPDWIEEERWQELSRLMDEVAP